MSGRASKLSGSAVWMIFAVADVRYAGSSGLRATVQLFV